MDPAFGADLASYTLTPGRRTSYVQHPTIELDRAISPTSGTFAPAPEHELEGSESDSSDGELDLQPGEVIFAAPQSAAVEDVGHIAFRTPARRADPQVRTLYGPPPAYTRTSFAGGKLQLNTADSEQQDASVPRRTSLVRPEEYMSPMPRVGSNFNPYNTPSWSRKPSTNLDQDLEYEGDLTEGIEETEEPNFRQHRFESVALPDATAQPGCTEGEAQAREVESPRTLGGKSLINTDDWRKRLRLDTPSPISRSPIKSPVYRAHLNSASSEKRMFDDEKILSPYHFSDKKAYDPAVVELDDALAPGSSKFLWLAPATVALSQALVIAYLVLRGLFLAQTAPHYHASSMVGGWIFFLVEILYALHAGISSIKAVVRNRNEDGKVMRIKGGAFLPTVDVLVVCSGQHDQLVMDSAIAAAKLDWPVDKLRVLVIDDSGSHELQRKVESHANSRALHLTYHRRSTRPQSADAPATPKSALINFGLTETRLNGRNPADFTLVLDADCIPDPDMLRALVSYMVKDQQLGLVRCSQVFYNVPSPLSSTLSTFINTLEPIEDARSGFLMRRCAVDDIGGFPTHSSVEDGQLASLLLGKGYHVKFLNETLQHGVVPDSFVLHLRQRLARRVATLRSAARMNFFVRGGLRLKHMSFFRRLGSLFTALAPLTSILVLGALLLLPVAVFLDYFLVPVRNVEQLNMLVRVLFAATMAERLHDVTFCLPTGSPSASSTVTRLNFLAPYTTFAVLRAAIKGVPTVNARFPLEQDERERASLPGRRTPLYRRLGSVMFGAIGTLLHLALALSILAALGYALGMNLSPFAQGVRTGRQAGLMALLTIAWPSVVLLWFSLLKAAAVPFAYALFPPTVPARDRLLVRDPITGIARPIPDCRRARPFVEKQGWGMLGALIITAYVTVLFALTFSNGLDI